MINIIGKKQPHCDIFRTNDSVNIKQMNFPKFSTEKKVVNRNVVGRIPAESFGKP